MFVILNVMIAVGSMYMSLVRAPQQFCDPRSFAWLHHYGPAYVYGLNHPGVLGVPLSLCPRVVPVTTVAQARWASGAPAVLDRRSRAVPTFPFRDATRKEQ